MSAQELNLALVLVGAVVLVLGLFSNLIKRIYLSEPLVATVVGIVLSPTVLGIISIGEWGSPEDILEQSARLTLAIGLMGVALRLPADFARQYLRPLVVLLGIIMAATWLTSGLLTYTILGFPFWIAMLLGATLTPTDPVLASTILTGTIAERILPVTLREVISAESGANDGLAYLFFFLPLYVLSYAPRQAALDWTTTVLVREVLGGVMFGFILGYVAGRMLKWVECRLNLGKTSFLAYTLALAMLALGVSYLIGSDGLLAVFVAGAAFSLAIRRSRSERLEDKEDVQEAVNRFFVMPVFVLFGLALPWNDWAVLGLPGIALACSLLLLRRIPFVVALRRALGPVKGLKNSLFVGWFGPIGVGAIYYGALAQRLSGNLQVWGVVSLVVFVSIVAHGLTSTPLTLLYGRTGQQPMRTDQSPS